VIFAMETNGLAFFGDGFTPCQLIAVIPAERHCWIVRYRGHDRGSWS
jgi:hypothetical protein